MSKGSKVCRRHYQQIYRKGQKEKYREETENKKKRYELFLEVGLSDDEETSYLNMMALPSPSDGSDG